MSDDDEGGGVADAAVGDYLDGVGGKSAVAVINVVADVGVDAVVDASELADVVDVVDDGVVS